MVMRHKILSLEDRAFYNPDDIVSFSDKVDIIFKSYSQHQLTRNVGGYDGIILDGDLQIDEEVLTKTSRLKVISRFGVGYDSVDVEACTHHKVYVTITPVLSEAVSELTFGLILCLSRSILKADTFTRKCWAKKTTQFPPGRDLHNKILGIIGLGRIGYQVAKRGYAFDMKILYTDKIRNKQAEKLFEAKRVPLDELLVKSDYTTIHMPLNLETRRMIGEKQLSQMKESAFLINTSRGGIIDQVALKRSLIEKQIAGAALDVFEVEPLPETDSLATLENVILTPHIGSNTVETRRRMGFVAIDNIIRVLEGRPPVNLVPEQQRLSIE